MPTDVILKVNELSTAAQYGKAKVTVEPVGDLLYAVHIPDGYEEMEDGTRVFNIEGIRHIIRALQVVLVIDNDKGDF